MIIEKIKYKYVMADIVKHRVPVRIVKDNILLV